MVKVSVVGTGKMGRWHLEKLKQVPDAQVVGFYETSATRAEEIKKQYQVPHFTNLTNLLFESDAVVVASPTPTHYAIARQALESGVSVLIEKPIAEDVAQVADLIALSEKNSLVLQPGFLERFRMNALIREALPKPVRFIECHRLTPSLGREATVDVLNDIMIHDLDLVMSLIDEEPSYLSAVGVPVVTGLCDLANVRLEFPSGAVANITASRTSPSYLRKFRVFSTNSYFSMDFMENRVDVLRPSNTGTVESESYSVAQLDPLLEQAKAFVWAVKEKRPSLVPVRDGLRALKIIDRVRLLIAERLSLGNPGAQSPFPELTL